MIASPAARIVMLGFGALLLWRILQVNAVTYGELNRPELRLPAEGPARKAALESELAANPTAAGILVQLGLELQRDGDAGSAARAFGAALQVAPIDRAALQAAVTLDVREGRVDSAVRRLDRLLTYYGDTREWIFPLLVQWLGAPDARAALETLAREPSTWMGAFLSHSCAKVDPLLAVPLLSRRVAAGLAGKDEARCGIEALRRAGHWAIAYQVWLNTLPRDRLADVGFVFNGDFEYAPTGIGFDWIVDERSAVHSADFPMGSGASGRRALRVAWTGKRVTRPAIHQYLALQPGRYELSGLARLDGLQSVRGVQWAVRCAGEARATLGTSARFIGSGEWQRFAFPLDIPAGCAGQVLQLEPVGLHEGTTYVAGRAWFDELRMARSN